MILKTSADWNMEDKLHGVYCYMNYRTQAQYLRAVGYFGKYVSEGKLAYKKSKSVYTALSKVFTDKEIDELTKIIA